jgi:hypothetical protein
VTSHAVRVWVSAAGKLLDDARQHLDAAEFFELVDLLKAQLAIGGRRGPELLIKIPIEGGIVAYIDADNPSESDRLRDWLRSDEEYTALIDQALALVRRERERRRAA